VSLSLACSGALIKIQIRYKPWYAPQTFYRDWENLLRLAFDGWFLNRFMRWIGEAVTSRSLRFVPQGQVAVLLGIQIGFHEIRLSWVARLPLVKRAVGEGFGQNGWIHASKRCPDRSNRGRATRSSPLVGPGAEPPLPDRLGAKSSIPCGYPAVLLQGRHCLGAAVCQPRGCALTIAVPRPRPPGRHRGGSCLLIGAVVGAGWT